ncbi:MAG: hypothetical protein WC855_09845 [Thermodesulfovibrionales bacterium]
MSSLPSWLPDLVSVDGVWDDTVTRLYAIFVTDIKDGKPRLNRAQVWWDRTKLGGEKYEEGFWHLVTKDNEKVDERLPDFRRAERLSWCRACIDNCSDRAILFWDYKVAKRIETYIWLKDHDYVLVFKKLNKSWGTVYFLLTAFYVDGDSSRRSLTRKYNDKL